MSASAPSSGGTMRCTRHNAETVLRCGKCDTPICTRCAVPTPVGARCPDCAGVKRFAMLVKPLEMARAIGYGIGAGALLTLILSFIPFLGLLGYIGMGFLVGEAVAVGANRKRARELGPVAVACVFLGYELGSVIGLYLQFGSQVGLSPELFVFPLQALRGLLGVGLLVGALLAWMRVR